MPLVLGEMRIEGRRVGLWVLVSRDPVALKVTDFPTGIRGRVEHRVAHWKELTLASLEGPAEPVDPMEQMRTMAEAFEREHVLERPR